MKLIRTLTFFLPALLCGALALAQTIPPQPPAKEAPQKQDEPTIRIETELVQIEVTVTDKAGNIIRDLKREDFELKEDGKPQDVAYFSMGTVNSPARWITTEPKAKAKDAAPAAPLAETRVGRYIVLAIDDLHVSFSNLVYARQALIKFVDEQVTNDDQVALITTSGQLGMHQQFTNNRDILKRAINRLAFAERRVAGCLGFHDRL